MDINGLPLDQIEALPNGELRIGALASNSAVANHKLVQQQYLALSQALLAGTSTQLRNMVNTAELEDIASAVDQLALEGARLSADDPVKQRLFYL